jgi:hypothetical protein
MNIINALKQLRDDIKTWVANNLNDLNKRLTKSINNIPKFSGDYNDLTNAPDISEDGSGNMIITDESGNIIFKADAEGIHTTAVSLNGETAATEKYVDDAMADIDVDLTGYATEDFVASAVESAKEDLSESIESETDEFHIVDNAGNIVVSIDENGVATTTVNAQTIIVNGIDIENKLNELAQGSGGSYTAITNEEIDEICSGTLTTFLEDIASEGVSF